MRGTQIYITFTIRCSTPCQKTIICKSLQGFFRAALDSVLRRLDVKKGTTVFKADYYVNAIFDPCREYGFNCCNDTFGAPEFRSLDNNPDSPTLGNWMIYSQDGTKPATETSRWPDDSTEYNPRCTNLMEPFDFCVAPLTARSPAPKRPTCWNYNATVIANQDCRAPSDGAALPYCLEIGVTSTAFVPECKDKDATDCGTFLEIHQPGDASILTEVKLQGQYLSGYKMAVMSLTYQRSGSKILCEGDHEVSSSQTFPRLTCVHISKFW